MLVSLRWVVKATHVWILTRPVLAVGHMRNGVQSYLLEWCKVPHCRWAQLISKMGDCVMVKHTFYLAIPFVCNRFLFHFPLNVLALVIFVLKGSGCSIHSPPVAVIWWLARRLFSVLWVPFSALPLLVGPVKKSVTVIPKFLPSLQKRRRLYLHNLIVIIVVVVVLISLAVVDFLLMSEHDVVAVLVCSAASMQVS